MSKRMVRNDKYKRNSENNSRRSVSRRVNLSKNTTKKINNFKYVNSFKVKDLDLKKMSIKKNSLLMGITVIITGAFGFVSLNRFVEPEEIVEATNQPVLPERKMPGVSKAGQKYADDAKIVMKKLQECQYRNDGKKVVYLTFDDGPSANSLSILDILKRNDIRATFFVTGQSIEHNGQKGKEILKRSYTYGNAIANHTYSHDYSLLYPNRTLDFDTFVKDLKKTDELLKNALGEDFSTNVIRCPGGQMSWNGMDKLQSYLDENGMASIDWNAMSGDDVVKNKTMDDLYNKVVETSEGKELVVLLMHDVSSSNEKTVKVLQNIIDYYKTNGYEFRTLV